jgi:excisionase family DNA binding protein
MPTQKKNSYSSKVQLTASPATVAEELMTTRELMGFLNLSRTKVWEYVQYEGLPAFKLGGDYRYRKAEVVQWLERYRVTGNPARKRRQTESGRSSRVDSHG